MLDYKYKEREPSETVQIIKNFFESNGFELQYNIKKSEANTYSCHIELLYKEKYILHSNGKGVFKDLCLASGFGELYERFCNKIKIYTQKNFYQKLIEINYKDVNYYLHKDEKQLTYQELCSDDKINNFLNLLSNNNDSYKKKIINYISNDKIIGIPYKNLLHPETKKFLDPRFLYRIMNSTGLCAGNSFEEAFNEGFSEILERLVTIDLISSTGIPEYINVDKQSLSPHLQNAINKIESKNNKFYLIDLSYHYKMPVVMGVLINLKDHYTQIDFGCFPIFDVAAMRTITEMYQNIESFDRLHDNLFIPTNKNFNNNVFLLEHKSGLQNSGYLPPFFFERVRKEKKYNENIFIDPNNNKILDIYLYYLNFIKEKKINIWYFDNSLIPNMTALSLYADNLKDFYPIDSLKLSVYDYNRLFAQLDTENHYEHIIYSNSDINIKDIDYNNLLLLQEESYNDKAFSLITYHSTTYPLPIFTWITNSIIFDLLNLNNDNIVIKYKDTFLFDIIKKYYIAKRCYDFGYSFEECQTALKNLGISDFTHEDFNGLNNLNYLYKKILLEPCQKYWHSTEYEELCKKFIS